MQVLPDLVNDVKGEFSLLGLGDIVIPGMFVALLLRYDAVSAKANPCGCFTSSFPRPYFIGNVIAYAMGLTVTVLIMYVFDHGQPALLYLVPACVGCSLIMGIARGDTSNLFAYDEEAAHAAQKAAALATKEGSDKKKEE